MYEEAEEADGAWGRRTRQTTGKSRFCASIATGLAVNIRTGANDGRGIEMSPTGEWLIRGIDASVALSFLQRHAPWRMELKFENGPKASDGPTGRLFNRVPLRKLCNVLKWVPPASIRGGCVLDIGFNAGYNSLYLAAAFNARVTGIDIVARHKMVAEELAAMIGVDPTFHLLSAEEFLYEEMFDLVLHLGTLYHLPNPVRSLERCFRSLKPGGFLALETICYRAYSDRDACKWINGFRDDTTNFWALGEGALNSMLVYCGFVHLKMVHDARPAAYNREMSRSLWIAQRPD